MSFHDEENLLLYTLHYCRDSRKLTCLFSWNIEYTKSMHNPNQDAEVMQMIII